MAEAGIVSNLVAKAIESMCSAALRGVISWWGARSELQNLEKTMRLIKARVQDAERCQEAESSEAIKEWLCRLKLVLYQADDLFDEVLTIGRQKQQIERGTMGKVGILFSKYGPLHRNWKCCGEIKSITKQLEDIKSDMDNLHLATFPAVQQTLSMSPLIRDRETGSHVNAEGVVGRKDDQHVIVQMLFDPKYDDLSVTVIPIVGFGGLGKTTLAQLVFNDERVKNHFDVRAWAHVPEKDNLFVIKGKIYNSFTGNNYDGLPLERIQQGISKFIQANKYLLVLDDIWYERSNRLVDLFDFLKSGKRGSKVIVTTRSDVIAKAVGTFPNPYRLEVLSDDQSWEFFKLIVFKQGIVPMQDPHNYQEVIGKEIIKMCGNVPLAIKVVGGTLIHSKDDERQWRWALNAQRSKAHLATGNDYVMDVLKLSYECLSPVLKQCFSYCSLLHKGDLFTKDYLVYKWMALGYFQPCDENTGDQLFLELLARGLFEHPKVSTDGNVEYCKMHDLLHDLAQCVAGEESKFLVDNYSWSQITDRLVHAKLVQPQPPPSLFIARRLRSLLLLNQQHGNSLEGIITRFKYLRVLRIGESKILKSIGKLIHLRYLEIVSMGTTKLPSSITKLQNLQTLKVDRCSNLIELPSGFVKLASLRNLFLPGYNDAFTDFPSEFGKLTSLERLNVFNVGKNNGVDELAALDLLTGELEIRFTGGRRNAIVEAQRANLNNNDQLSALQLDIKVDVTPPFDEMNEMLMHLQLPPNLKKLTVRNYKGGRMPTRWVDGLSNLVSVTIMWCKCTMVPDLSQLPHLKYFQLEQLDELEYVEDINNNNTATQNVYFPSLEVLRLENMPRLKGWTRASQASRGGRLELFPKLVEMTIYRCPELMSMPIGKAKLQSLYVRDLVWTVLESNHEDGTMSPLLSNVSESLQELHLEWVDLVSLSIGYKLNELTLLGCDEIENLRFQSLNSIRILQINDCKMLRNIEGLQYLTNLEALYIKDLELEQEEGAVVGNTTTTTRITIRGWHWQHLKSLRSLELGDFPEWTELPSGIASLTSLQDLSIVSLNNLTHLPSNIANLSSLRLLWIQRCPKLNSLPTSLVSLPSLHTLRIYDCPDLQQRYQPPNGQDCHLIQHILHVDLD